MCRSAVGLTQHRVRAVLTAKRYDPRARRGFRQGRPPRLTLPLNDTGSAAPIADRLRRQPDLELAEEGLQDRAALALLRQDRPGDPVDQQAQPVEDREDAEP